VALTIRESLPPALAGVVDNLTPPAPRVAAVPGKANFSGTPSRSEAQVRPDYGKLPLAFEQNSGQTDARVNFLARTGNGTVFLTPTAAVFAMQPVEQAGSLLPEKQAASLFYKTAGGTPASRQPGVALYMNLVGANPSARAAGVDPLPGKVNYFIGNDPAKWHTNVPTFSRVEYADVYPGIDLAFYGGAGGLEYDITVSPGVDPHAITLNFTGADGVEVNGQGDLVVHTAVGDVVQSKPYAYQEVNGRRQEVVSGFVQTGSDVHFHIGAYDPGRPIIIDPVIIDYSTLLGGDAGPYGDAVSGIAADNGGNAYLTGWTSSASFPTTPGAFDTTYNGSSYDAFAAKLNPSGSGLVYSTFLGGSGWDFGSAVAVDRRGDAILAGFTGSGDFPTTPGAFDRTANGGYDTFVTKLNANGTTLAYSTFLGGKIDEYCYALAVDRGGNAYVAGYTTSADFPTTPGAFDVTYHGGPEDAFVAKLSASGSTLVYSTFLGGSALDMAFGVGVDHSGQAYVTGATLSDNFPTTPGAYDPTKDGSLDAFVTKLDANGSALVYSTFLGGSQYEYGFGLAVDSENHAYVTGNTASADFPTTPTSFDPSYNGGDTDGFVSKLGADGATLIYSTYLGGSSEDRGNEIAVDAAGNAYVTGWTLSADFPVTPDAFDASYNGSYDACVAELGSSGSALIYGTFLGGTGEDRGYAITVDGVGNVYAAGRTDSNNFPTTQNSLKQRNPGGFDGFVTKFTAV
jgi:hypothetical protein